MVSIPPVPKKLLTYNFRKYSPGPDPPAGWRAGLVKLYSAKIKKDL